MLSELAVYLYAVLIQYGGLLAFVALFPDTAAWIWDENMLAVLSGWLDRRITRLHRFRIYRAIFLFAIFVSGFLAWREQYEIATNKTGGSISVIRFADLPKPCIPDKLINCPDCMNVMDGVTASSQAQGGGHGALLYCGDSGQWRVE